MIDYHIHVSSVSSAKLYVQYLNKQYSKEKNIICFSNHGTLDLYDYPIVDFGVRLGITIIKSVSFISSDDIELNVLNPTKIDKILKFYLEEKLNYITHILTSLSDLKIYITPFQLLEKIGKASVKDLYHITNINLASCLVDSNYCEDIQTGLSIISQVDIPRLFMDTEELLELLDKNIIYVNNFNKFIEYESYNNGSIQKIKGFITNDKNIKGLYPKLNILYGSGSDAQ